MFDNACEVVGFRQVNFTDDKTGRVIQGTSLFLLAPSSSFQVIGKEAYKLFVGANVSYSPHVGDHILISYNRYGKPDHIEVL